MNAVINEKAILVADSGSTKTDWALMLVGAGEASPVTLQTQGINPVLMSEDDVAAILQDELLSRLEQLLPIMAMGQGLEVFFYGAGVRPDMVSKMERAFRRAMGFHETVVGRMWQADVLLHFNSDLLGAARALCGRREGIACILGTGANSCLYDGGRIVQNTPALGFILGDEGGGAALGKRFLNAIFKGLLPASMRDDFLATTGLTLADVIARVYREPMPNRFLASTSLYIGQHLDNGELRSLVVENFRQFFRHNIVPYGRCDLPVDFVGSIASHYESLLREAAEAEGFSVGRVLKSPIASLCNYHRNG